MNSWIGVGRLTKDPDVRYAGDTQQAVCRFTLAIDRPSRDGEKKADFPQVTVFGRQAENCGKYLAKGSMVCVRGSIQTGSYTNKNGEKVYVTGVTADRVEFLSRPEKEKDDAGQYGFEYAATEESLPF